MGRLLSLLIFGCWHKWVILHRVPVYYKGEGSGPRAFDYEMQCERCGNIKVKRT